MDIVGQAHVFAAEHAFLDHHVLGAHLDLAIFAALAERAGHLARPIEADAVSEAADFVAVAGSPAPETGCHRHGHLKANFDTKLAPLVSLSEEGGHIPL